MSRRNLFRVKLLESQEGLRRFFVKKSPTARQRNIYKTQYPRRNRESCPRGEERRGGRKKRKKPGRQGVVLITTPRKCWVGRLKNGKKKREEKREEKKSEVYHPLFAAGGSASTVHEADPAKRGSDACNREWARVFVIAAIPQAGRTPFARSAVVACREKGLSEYPRGCHVQRRLPALEGKRGREKKGAHKST